MANINCGFGDFWVEHALTCVPEEVAQVHHERLAFVSMPNSDARRLTPKFTEGRHVIVLSERIVPRRHVNESSPEVRYFVFAILHEVAHAVLDHRPPSEISFEENERQEQEANELAFQWFNDALAGKAHPDIPPFTTDELAAAQAKTRAEMLAAPDRA